MYLQSIKSVKDNAAKSVSRSILKKSRHIGFVVFLVHLSMHKWHGGGVGLADQNWNRGHAIPLTTLHRKKRFTSFPSPAGMSLTKLTSGRNNSVMTSLFPSQGEFGDIPAGDGKVANLFLRCTSY
jgi:hypothetical protein